MPMSRDGRSPAAAALLSKMTVPGRSQIGRRTPPRPRAIGPAKPGLSRQDQEPGRASSDSAIGVTCPDGPLGKRGIEILRRIAKLPTFPTRPSTWTMPR